MSERPKFDELRTRTDKKFENFAVTLRALLNDPEIQEGNNALVRSIINVAISCADVVPGAGEVASWGADLLKLVDEIQYRQRKQIAQIQGESTQNIKRSKFNLTPDVHILTATVTEMFEFISFFGFPTHAIETASQLIHDIPRMQNAIRKMRLLIQQMQKDREDALEAARSFLPDSNKDSSQE